MLTARLMPSAMVLLVMRYLFDFSGDALVNNAVGDGATRTDSTEIEMYLESLMNKF